jgi:predicted GNAT family acetyltransferase
MEWIVRDNDGKHRFEIDLGDGSFAIADYVHRDGKILFTHTEVPSQREGKGLGTALVKFALAAARKQGLKVAPICPFVASYIASHPEEQDLLDPAWRKKLDLAAKR